MTTRVWTVAYVTNTVFPALVAAGYEVNGGDGFFKVADPDNGEVSLTAMAKDEAGRDFIVRYDAKLFDENVEREYPNGM